MHFLVIDCNLGPGSRTLTLANLLREFLSHDGAEARLRRLADDPLPLCDGGPSFEDPAVDRWNEMILPARGVILASPVYNYGLNAAAKNLIELTGPSWPGKLIGILVTAGGLRSYMGPVAFANTLALDFRALVLPRYVYAGQEDFDEERRPLPELTQRLQRLALQMCTIAGKLSPEDIRG